MSTSRPATPEPIEIIETPVCTIEGHEDLDEGQYIDAKLSREANCAAANELKECIETADQGAQIVDSLAQQHEAMDREFEGAFGFSSTALISQLMGFNPKSLFAVATNAMGAVKDASREEFDKLAAGEHLYSQHKAVAEALLSSKMEAAKAMLEDPAFAGKALGRNAEPEVEAPRLAKI